MKDRLIGDEIGPGHDEALAQEITELEQRLARAKAKAQQRNISLSDEDSQALQPHEEAGTRETLSPSPSPIITSPSNHFLLLLSDSALPLGSFAFSSGLESYLAHSKSLDSTRTTPSFSSFLPLSLSSFASTTLPFVLAAHRDPARLPELDDALDAAIICTVGRRASVAQGRALLSLWDRAFSASSTLASSGSRGLAVLKVFSAHLRRQTSVVNKQSSPAQDDDDDDGDDDLPPQISAHLAPLFGVIGHVAGLSLDQTAYAFMLGHVKALVSAAVRAGMFGPYQAQKTLAGATVQELIAAMIQREWTTPVEETGQCVPVMDLWFGRHEMLYSRIFNS